MSDSSTSFWKSMAFFLLLALIGVYLLYEWYDDQLYARLAEKDALIDQSSAQIRATDTRLHQVVDAQDSVQAEIAALRNRHQEEKALLTEQLERLAQEKAAFGQNLASLRATHADDLAAEQQKTRQAVSEREELDAAYAELKRLHEADQAKMIALQSDLSNVHKAIEKTAAEHQAKVTELENHLNERVKLSKTTPMDADLLRTALAAGVLTSDEVAVEDGQALTGQLAETTSRLEALQADHDAVRQQLAETQQQLERTQSELEQSQSKLTEVSPLDGDGDRIAVLNEQIETEKNVRTELLQQHQAALIALMDTLDDTKQKLAAVEDKLRTAQAETSETDQGVLEQVASANAQVATLEARLEEDRRQSASAQQTLRDEAEKAIAKLRAREAGFADLGGTYTPRGVLLRLMEAELRFSPGQATLPAGELASLERIAALLKEQPELTVRIEGHTDSLGGAELNLSLSQRRAEAVRQSLIERGVEAVRLSVEGIGAARPIADNATAAGRSLNRRVEVYVKE
ncbi:OmpA family protein [Thiocystis minor]|uniref:OmpA family protein n=1 Tax=Thiocystis minor TaxID=61597 RepID=UPI0019143E81|nr:OmpA family protein [Thiocystis minor]